MNLIVANNLYGYSLYFVNIHIKVFFTVHTENENIFLQLLKTKVKLGRANIILLLGSFAPIDYMVYLE